MSPVPLDGQHGQNFNTCGPSVVESNVSLAPAIVLFQDSYFDSSSLFIEVNSGIRLKCMHIAHTHIYSHFLSVEITFSTE